ncbi:hypothetical protein KVT40_000175 [Elsinoe batatas]|uniref:DJ-1/PfpI domain-containing protein n=1 Tax=Elsinoe batatas TaxID=2601811 RepID=A0A8K0PG69_9PEZI|nr:hypothetical protein KVT40_009279 [Elsinoe batatas]KAG8631035.1 hypothetical protein KVT40_000175 [Elsinoe batatas]
MKHRVLICTELKRSCEYITVVGIVHTRFTRTSIQAIFSPQSQAAPKSTPQASSIPLPRHPSPSSNPQPSHQPCPPHPSKSASSSNPSNSPTSPPPTSSATSPPPTYPPSPPSSTPPMSRFTPFAPDITFHFPATTLAPTTMTPGITVLPSCTYDDVPRDIDVLLIGGPLLTHRPEAAARLMREVWEGGKATVLTTCVGSLWFADAIGEGLKGRKMTTNRGFIPAARKMHPGIEWVDQRWVERNTQLWRTTL